MPFAAFNTMFVIVFVLIIGVILVSVIRGISQWSYNNKQPVLTVDATVVTKRTDVRRRHNTNGNHHHHTSTTYYYVTFEVESGDRMEFHVKSDEYGMLVEGDYGSLKFQGTRYLDFQRTR